MIQKTLQTLKIWAKRLKSEIVVLYVAVRDPRTPVVARYFAYFVIGYALSPIDLIPDFIPILGLLDELILLPVALFLLIRMIPPIVMAAARRRAEQMMRSGLPASRTAAMVILTLWALVVTACISWSVNQLFKPVGTAPVTPVYETNKNAAPPFSGSSDSRRLERDRSRDR